MDLNCAILDTQVVESSFVNKTLKKIKIIQNDNLHRMKWKTKFYF